MYVSMCIVDVCTCVYTYTSLYLYQYIYTYNNGRCLSILIDKYTIFLMCMHLACMYSYLEKNTLYIPLGTLNDFHLLIFTLFIYN